MKPEWQCWHLGGSRAPQTALVWSVSVCIPSLHSGGLAFLENQGRQAGGATEDFFFFFFLTTTGLHCGCRIFSCGMQLLGCSMWSLVP